MKNRRLFTKISKMNKTSMEVDKQEEDTLYQFQA